MTKTQIVEFLFQCLDIKYLEDTQGFSKNDFEKLKNDVFEIINDLEILELIKKGTYIFHFEGNEVVSIGTCKQSNLTLSEIDKLGKWLIKQKDETRWVDGVKGISSPVINTYGYKNTDNLYKYPIDDYWKNGKEQREETENTINKDLEVLKILKKKKVVIDWNSNDVFTFGEHLTKEEENKIKEWMKNDN